MEPQPDDGHGGLRSCVAQSPSLHMAAGSVTCSWHTGWASGSRRHGQGQPSWHFRLTRHAACPGLRRATPDGEGGSLGGSGGGIRGSGGPGMGPSGNGPQPAPHPTSTYPAWLKVWLWATALAYLAARSRWRAEREAKQQLFEKEAAVEEQQQEEWGMFVKQYAAQKTLGVARAQGLPSSSSKA